MARTPIPPTHFKPVPESASVKNPIQPTESKPIVGLGVASCVGLRVLLSQEGKNKLRDTALGKASKGKAGYITKVHQVQAAVMIHWESSDVDEEAGWYRTGAHGDYHLELHQSGNSLDEIQRRSRAVQESEYEPDAYVHNVFSGNL